MRGQASISADSIRASGTPVAGVNEGRRDRIVTASEFAEIAIFGVAFLMLRRTRMRTSTRLERLGVLVALTMASLGLGCWGGCETRTGPVSIDSASCSFDGAGMQIAASLQTCGGTIDQCTFALQGDEIVFTVTSTSCSSGGNHSDGCSAQRSTCTGPKLPPAKYKVGASTVVVGADGKCTYSTSS